MPRKTNSNSPPDWLYIAQNELIGLRALSEKELSYDMCRSKLAEVIEKVLKAELLRLGWHLEKTHDLGKLAGELNNLGSVLGSRFRPLINAYADLYFIARYPGFDLEDPDWPGLRKDIADVQSMHDLVAENISAD